MHSLHMLTEQGQVQKSKGELWIPEQLTLQILNIIISEIKWKN